jgi:Ca-activated chloride channel family protein
VDSNDPISNIYSPSHPVGISRDSDGKGFRVGYEATNIIPDGDFSLYYGIENESINLNLLTYRESANRDGFFMLLVQPPVEVPDEQIVPKDVIVVLDQSGSMEGEKWDQARKAATYVLDNLNEDDRFNVIPFSTGWRLFSNELAPADEAGEAIGWIEGLWAEGGTDINGALLTALEMAHPERSTTVMFLTDGLATEGEIESDRILENLGASAGRNVQVFTFGVGDDVDTFLLDSIVRDHHGSASYVRPGERIDEEVASLYNKISAPVLTNITLDFDPVRVELLYPTELPDLFAGEQLTLVGRYRDAAEGIDIKLRGEVNNQEQIFIYDNLDFRERAGGEPFIARLWATRRIGDLLNTIRLRGENPELIDSVVNLSIRYGIITPYTSFLIEEDDILSREGRLRANENFAEEAEVLANTSTGASAVDAADDINRNLAAAQSPIAQPTMSAPVGGLGGGNGSRLAPPVPGEEPDADGEFSRDQQGYFGSPIQNVNEKTFLLQDGVWNDTTFDPDNMTTNKVVFLSDEYFELLEEHPELGDYFALGENLIVVIDGVAWEIVPE